MSIATQKNIAAPPGAAGDMTFVVLISLVAAVGGLLFGFDTAVISGANDFLKAQFTLNDTQLGFVASCVLIGCAVGAGFAGMLADRFGRKKILFLSALFFALSAWGAAMPHHVLLPPSLIDVLVNVLSLPARFMNYLMSLCFPQSALLHQGGKIILPLTMQQFVLARFVGGLGIGIASMLSPLYIAEIAPARVRGSLVSLNQFAIISGILVAYLVDWLCVKIFPDPAVSWRWMFGAGVAPAVVFIALLALVPESPRWLAKQGLRERACAILTRVGGRAHAEAELADIAATVAQEGGSIAQLFGKGLRLALLIGVALAIFQQITGINTVLYYTTSIFKSAGFGTSAALLSSVGVGAINGVFTVFAIMLVDRLGRKPLLLIGAAGMGISIAAVAAAFQHKASGMVIMICVLAYVASFALTLGPVVWVVISEIFPTRIRGRGMSVATVLLWVSCYAVSQSFPMLVERKGIPFTYYLYAAVCFVMIAFVAALVPETKGKTLEEIERKWLK